MPKRTDLVNVLLVGGGGREHALAQSIATSPLLGELWTTHPGNPGLASVAKPIDVPVLPRELYRLTQFCDRNAIGLVVIGPEEPLAQGFADALVSPTRAVFGPTAEGAKIESNKAWAKQLMRGASIPTAEARIFTDREAAKSYLETRETPQVIKAAGLAKGKGVFVPASLAEALDAIDQVMVKRVFGDAGRTVVIEERLEGPELSVLALTDSRTITILEPCRDHKRLRDNDEGPNTGGMGVVCASDLCEPALLERIEREVLVPTVDAIRREGIDYRGVLYAGLMLTPAGPKVLEFNARFGDPECQALLARVESDVLELLLAAAHRRLDQVEVRWRPGASCCVVLASDGYPDAPRTGRVITGVKDAEALPDVRVCHAATATNQEGELVTAGGRVLSVTGLGATVAEARQRAYTACDLIQFEGKTARRDIGLARPEKPARAKLGAARPGIR